MNTIPASKIIEALGHSTVPFVVYVHEMPPTYDMLPRGSLLFLVKNARGFIACSEAAAEPIRKMGVKKLFTFYETIDGTSIRKSDQILYDLRTKYGDYDNIFVIYGTSNYRKGLHLIPEIASFLRSKNAALIWVGGATWPTSLIDYVERVKEQEGLDNLFLVGRQTGTTYYTYLNLASAFLLTSIEEPYPLVMLEAAYLRKPIIAFRSGVC